jgi:hypothetical protein
MAMLSNLDLIRRVPLFSLLSNEQAQGIADEPVGSEALEMEQAERRGCGLCYEGRQQCSKDMPGRAATEPGDQAGRCGYRSVTGGRDAGQIRLCSSTSYVGWCYRYLYRCLGYSFQVGHYSDFRIRVL